MKRKIKFSVYPLAVIFVSLYVFVGCSNLDPKTDPIKPPTLTTIAVSDITETSAKSGGNISDDGGGEITIRGVVWCTEVNPTWRSHSGITDDGTGDGIFQSNISGLSPETTYYVRAYANNLSGISYGNEVIFETIQSPFSLTLKANPPNAGVVKGAGSYPQGELVDIIATANEGWEFVLWTGDTQYLDNASEANTTVTMPSLDISITAHFELVSYKLTLDANPNQGGSAIGGGEYYFGNIIQIEATANIGWRFLSWSGDIEYVDNPSSAYTTVNMPANDINLTANFQDYPIYGDGVMDIDGNVYQTVIIGDQEWMAENLRVTRFRNGAAISTNLSDNDWINFTEAAYAIYPYASIAGLNSDAEVVAAYGKLYNQNAVLHFPSLCPYGWRVPSLEDWFHLTSYLMLEFGYHDDPDGDLNGVGNALKSCRQIYTPLGADCDTSEHPRWNSHGTHYGFDAVGFSALPGGSRGSYYSNLGDTGFWWTSTPHYFMVLFRDSGNQSMGGGAKWMGSSVKCVRDVVPTKDE